MNHPKSIPVDASLEHRCQQGQGCVEVISRLHAADIAEYVHGDREHADRLRDIARKFAELHHHGSPPTPLREAS